MYTRIDSSREPSVQIDFVWTDLRTVLRTKERVRNMRAHTSERAQESKRRQDRRELNSIL